MLSSLVFSSLVSADLLERLHHLHPESVPTAPRLGDRDEDDVPQVGGNHDTSGHPAPWKEAIALSEVKDGMIVMVANAFFENNRLGAYNDQHCGIWDGFTNLDQLWNLSSTPDWPGVSASHGPDSGRMSYQITNYFYRGTHWNRWADCNTAALEHDNSWDFLPHPNHPDQFQIFNSEQTKMRFSSWTSGDQGDADFDVIEEDHDYPDQYWHLKTPFIAKPKWVVADDEWNNGDDDLDMKFMMHDGFTEDVKMSILIDDTLLPGMDVPTNDFMVTMTQTFTDLASMLRMNGNNTQTLVASVENSVKRASDPSYMDQYLRNHPVYCTAGPGKHMCLYQLHFEMQDVVMVKPWTFQTSVYGVNQCRPGEKKGMDVDSPSLEGALYAGECGY